jgi:anaerobic selenocysteine-containing dehydrogenase
MEATETIRSTCGFCHIGCGILVHMKGMRVSGIEGDKAHPLNRGLLCAKGHASVEYLYHPHRVLRPLKRAGKRGEGTWVPVSWDEAIGLVCQRLGTLRDDYGARSVAIMRGSAKGLQDDYLARFANVFGSPNFLSMGYVCFIPRKNASLFTYGFYAVPDLNHPTKAIVVWGENVSETLHYNFSRIMQAQKTGAKLIIVDPHKSKVAGAADLWVRPKPGSDLPLALAVLHTIVNESLYDREFVETETTGFEELRKHLELHTPEWAASLTSLDPQVIRRMARLYAACRPAVIEWGNGIDHNRHNFQTARALCILRAICGNLEMAGGEIRCLEPPTVPRGSMEMSLHHLISPEVRSMRITGGAKLLPNVFYALQPPVLDAMLTGKPYPVRGGFVQGSNPLLTYPNARKVKDALSALDFLVVSDMFMTPTAALADVVLPAATFLECNSISAPPYAYPVVSAQRKVTRIPECRSDYEILRAIAQGLGQGEHFRETEEEFLDFILRPSGLTFDDLCGRGFIEGEKLDRSYRETGFATPSKKVEIYSARLNAWGFDPLPDYRFSDDFEDDAFSGTPLLSLTSWKRAPFRHSDGRQIDSLRAAHPEPLVVMHPDTAFKAGIAEGDPVVIRASSGSIVQKACFSSDIDQGVIFVDYGWWFPETVEAELFSWDRANANILTDDAPPYGREMGTPRLRGIPCTIARAGD